MQHCIFGSGQIGSYVGSVLTLNQQCVTYVARGAWLERLNCALMLRDYHGNTANVPSQQAVEVDNVPTQPLDVCWLTVKCTGVEAAVKDMAPFVGPETLIICCQNGLGSEQQVKEAFPDNRVMRAMVPFNVIFEAPNILHRGSEGTMVLECHDDDTQMQQIAAALKHTMLPVRLAVDFQAVLWAKLQLNLGNAVNALADVPVKEMLSDRGYRRVIARSMRELLAVCSKQNITLPKVGRLHGKVIPLVLSLPDFLFERLAKQMLAIDPKVRTSMWWDMHAGKKTEIDYLNGAVVHAAESTGVACSANRALIHYIKQAESERQKTGNYRPVSASELLKVTA